MEDSPINETYLMQGVMETSNNQATCALKLTEIVLGRVRK